MALLGPIEGGRAWRPPCEAVIGRSPLCTLQLSASDISKEHASLRWSGSAWELRDLNSRNGTFVAGERLKPASQVRLLAGVTVRFGATAAFVVEDDTPPRPMARRSDTGAWVEATRQLLALPDDDDPRVAIVPDGNGRWLREDDGETAEVQHGDAVTVAGATWQLFLPSVADETVEPSAGGPTIAGAGLSFRVSRDEEHIELVVRTAAGEVDLKARAHHQVALLLARARLSDAGADVPAPEQGWLYHDDLARMLGTERTHVNVAIFRLRKQLEDAGFVDAARCIERRLPSGQLRIGVADLVIRPSR